MEYIRIGVIVKPHGIKGSLKIKTFTSFVRERFQANHTIYRFDGNSYVPVEIKAVRGAQGTKLQDDENVIYVTFSKFEDINMVEAWRNQELFIKKDELHSLEDDEVYYFQLKDAEVFEDGKLIGVVSELIETGANLVLRVSGDEEILIPYVKQFIQSVDVENKKIDVKLLEGMR